MSKIEWIFLAGMALLQVQIFIQLSINRDVRKILIKIAEILLDREIA